MISMQGPLRSFKRQAEQLSVTMLIALLMICCGTYNSMGNPAAAKETRQEQVTEAPAAFVGMRTSEEADCYAYLTELVRSSNFPFKEIDKNKVNILIDEDRGDFLRLKLFFDTEGTGTIGWAEYYPQERKLLNSSANLETPEPLTFERKYAVQYEQCSGILSTASSPAATSTSCIGQTTSTLPWTTSLQSRQNNFKDLSCHLKGEEAYLCDRTHLHCLPIPAKGNIQLLAVPMDCGDFTYRYYLLTVKDNSVTDGLYIEGEWQEPEDDNSKQRTSFTMDKQFILTTTTQTKTGTRVIKYTIGDDGAWQQKP